MKTNTLFRFRGIRFCPPCHRVAVHDRGGGNAIDAGKITSTLGFAPEHRFEDGLKKTLDWFLKNQHM